MKFKRSEQEAAREIRETDAITTKITKLGVVALLSFALMFSFIGCGSGDDAGNGGSSTGGSEAEPKAEWEIFLDDYEAWANDYIAMVDKYVADPTDASLVTEATELMNEATTWATRASEIESSIAQEDYAAFEERAMAIVDKLTDASTRMLGAAS